MDNSNVTNIENQKKEFNFLSEIYDVMKCFENNPSKVGNKINELKLKFEKARSILSTVSGIDMSHTEQLDYYQSLLKQYKHEKELLESYKEMCNFDISQLEQQPTTSTNKNECTIPVKENEEKNDLV